MAGENFQFYSAQITRKCICETFLSPLLHDLIISPHVNQPPINAPPKKSLFSMQSFFKKKFPILWGEETLCFEKLTQNYNKSIAWKVINFERVHTNCIEITTGKSFW